MPRENYLVRKSREWKILKGLNAKYGVTTSLTWRRSKIPEIIRQIVEVKSRFEPEQMYVHDYGMVAYIVKGQHRTIKGLSFESFHGDDSDLNKAVLCHIHGNANYDEEYALDDISVTSTKEHSVVEREITEEAEQRIKKMEQDCMDVQPLRYFGWTKQSSRSLKSDNSCGIDLCKEHFDASPDKLSEILDRPIDKQSPMTGNDLIKVAKQYRRALIVVDGPLLNVIGRNIEDTDNADKTYAECKQARKQVITVAVTNSHFYELNKDARENVLKRENIYNPEDDKKKPESVIEEKVEVKANYTIVDTAFKAMELAAEMTTQNYDGLDEPDKYLTPDQVKGDLVQLKKNLKTGLDKMKKEYKNKRDAIDPKLRLTEKRTLKAKLKVAHNNSVSNFKNCNAAYTARLREVAQESADYDKSKQTMDRHIIFVTETDLNDIYVDHIKTLNVAHKCVITDRVVTTIIYDEDEHVKIVASKNAQAIINAANNLGVPIDSETTVPALTSSEFKNIADANGWAKSNFNALVKNLVDHRKYSGIKRADKYDLGPGEMLKAVDVTRNYTSVAESGGFYTIGYESEPVVKFKYAKGTVGMYYVEGANNDVIDGCGLYDYQVVDYCIENGLVEVDMLKAVIYAKLAPQNDKTLKQFVKKIYSTIDDDSSCKMAVNFKIGNFGRDNETTKGKTVVVAGQDELNYYCNIIGNHDVTTFRNPEGKVLQHNNQPVFGITGQKSVTLKGSDKLIRLAILQRARVVVHKYMKNVIAAGFDVVRISTDAITYVTKGPAYPVPTNPKRGELRFEHINGNINVREHRSEPAEPYPHMANEWSTVITASETADFNAADLLDHKRLFLSGPAGTGKTFVLNQLYDLLKSQGKNVMCAALTHVAANLLPKGRTLNSLLGMGLNGKQTSTKMYNSIVTDVDALIIDEVSMANAEALHLLGELPSRISIYFAGDMRQCEKIITDGTPTVNADQNHWFKALCNFTKIELRKQHRANPEYANACIKYADGGKLPNLAMCAPEQMPIEATTSYISHTNKKRRIINNEVMVKFATDNKIEPVEMNGRVCMDYKENDRKPGNLYSHELYDRDKLGHILKHKEKYAEKLTDSRSRDPMDCLVISEKYYVNSYMNKKGQWVKPVEYHQTGANTRYIPELSQGLATLTRKIRHTIANTFYNDFDLINAHPVILIHLCRWANVQTPLLSQYISNREAVFNRLCRGEFNKAFVKKMILAVINGGSADYSKYIEDGKNCEWMPEFKAEMECVHKHFVEKSKPAEYLAHCEKRRVLGKSPDADAGAWMNKRLIASEVQIMDVVMSELRKMDAIDNFVLCSDGIMIRKDLTEGREAEIITSIEKVIKAVTKFEMGLIVKPMDNVLELPETLESYKPDNLSHINPRLHDEFPYVYEKMPVIANKTGNVMYNNEFFTIKEKRNRGFECVIANGALTRDRTDKETRRMKKDVLQRARDAFRSDNEIKRITKQYEEAFSVVYTRMLEETEKAFMDELVTEGLFYVLQGGSRTIMVKHSTLMDAFNPRYCMTAYKAQGRTMIGKVIVAEFDAMQRFDKHTGIYKRNAQYVAITRVTDPANIMIVR